MSVRSPEALVSDAAPAAARGEPAGAPDEPAAAPAAPRTLAASDSSQPGAGEAFPLAIRNVSKRWRKDLPLVLDDVDLALEPGTLTWVGGRNGAGKTTLLRIAAGLIEPEQRPG